MSIAQTLVTELDSEMASTRRVLACVTDANASFRPHPKSWMLVELGAHIANLPTWVGRTLDSDKLDLAPLLALPRPKPGTRAEMLAAFDANSKAARAKLVGSTDARLLAPWSLERAGSLLFTMPRVAVLRSFVLSHVIHHRGQMTVYLRLVAVPLPSIYGPTADTPG